MIEKGTEQRGILQKTIFDLKAKKDVYSVIK